MFGWFNIENRPPIRVPPKTCRLRSVLLGRPHPWPRPPSASARPYQGRPAVSGWL